VNRKRGNEGAVVKQGERKGGKNHAKSLCVITSPIKRGGKSELKG